MEAVTCCTVNASTAAFVSVTFIKLVFFFFFFFFLNPNLYSARVQLGTEAVTLLQAYYDYEEKVKAAASVSWPRAEKEIAGLGGRIGSLAASQTSDSA